MLEDMIPPVKIFPCKVREVTETLEDSDAVIFTKALNDVASWSNNGLAAALNKRGVYISEKSIRKHRRKECSCA